MVDVEGVDDLLFSKQSRLKYISDSFKCTFSWVLFNRYLVWTYKCLFRSSKKSFVRRGWTREKESRGALRCVERRGVSSGDLPFCSEGDRSDPNCIFVRVTLK